MLLPVGVFVCLIFVLYGFLALSKFIKNNIKLFAILLVVLACIGVAILIIRLLLRKYDNLILAESEPIKNLLALNNEYKFKQVTPMNFEHRYDNVNFYENVSPEDFLVEKLTQMSGKVLSHIQFASDNNKLYNAYKSRVDALRRFNMYLNVRPLFSTYVARREEEFFDDLIQDPCTCFYITVNIYLTKINGSVLCLKKDTFDSDYIKTMIECINNKDGAFYRDTRVWDAICRVERAKVSNKMRFSIYERDGNRCRKCGSRYDLEIDHIFPISKGGKSVYDNLQTLCHDCNVEKSNNVEKGVHDPRFVRVEHLCPNCNTQLVLRNGKYGSFYGCPNYPKCRFTKNL